MSGAMQLSLEEVLQIHCAAEVGGQCGEGGAAGAAVALPVVAAGKLQSNSGSLPGCNGPSSPSASDGPGPHCTGGPSAGLCLCVSIKTNCRKNRVSLTTSFWLFLVCGLLPQLCMVILSTGLASHMLEFPSLQTHQITKTAHNKTKQFNSKPSNQKAGVSLNACCQIPRLCGQSGLMRDSAAHVSF